jgi:hypothetical protein
VRERWGLSDDHATQMIFSARVIAEVEASPTRLGEDVIEDLTIAHGRALARIEDAGRRVAFLEECVEANGGKVPSAQEKGLQMRGLFFCPDSRCTTVWRLFPYSPHCIFIRGQKM